MSKIFAIYPIDKSSSTRFLNRINTFEKNHLGNDWHCFKIRFSDEEHSKCLIAALNSRFIIFMGHGGESKLCGACAKNGEETVDEVARQENIDYYNNHDYINIGNVNIFKGHILCCFSCNSNRNSAKSLGRRAIQYGVTSFIGFGDIPTDFIEENNFSKRCIAIYKGYIVKIMKHSLYIAISGNCTVDGFINIIKLLTTKEIQNLQSTKHNIRHKSKIINRLVEFKNDIRVLGDPYARLCIH